MSDTDVTPVATDAHPSDARDFPWSILLVCFVVLLPVLAFPFGQDQSTFVRGGREILSGGTLYVDFIDVKPPLIYVLYGIVDFFSGGSIVLIRAFEILCQLIAIALLLVTVKSFTISRVWLWVTAIIYAMMYATLGYSQSGQAESFCAIPVLGALICATKMSGRSRWVVLALCMAVAFCLKYTLVVIGPAAMIVWLLRDGPRASWRAVAGASMASIVFTLAILTPFLVRDGFISGWQTTLAYLSVYASYPPIGLPFVTDAIKLLGAYFGDILSLLVTCLVLLGSATLLLKRYTDRESALTIAALWMFLVLVATVILERKFSPYHFSRLFIPISVLVGAGASLLPLLRDRLALASHLRRWALAVLCVGLLVLSPLPRYVNVAQLAVRSIGNPHVYDAYLTRPELPGFDFTAIRALKSDLDVRLASTDRLLLMSMMATPILTHLPTRYTSPFVDSHLYFSNGAPGVWRARAASEMRASSYVVVDTIDVCEGVNLHARTSWQSLRQDSLLMPILQSNFTAVDTVACFIIYKRIAS